MLFSHRVTPFVSSAWFNCELYFNGHSSSDVLMMSTFWNVRDIRESVTRVIEVGYVLLERNERNDASRKWHRSVLSQIKINTHSRDCTRDCTIQIRGAIIQGLSVGAEARWSLSPRADLAYAQKEKRNCKYFPLKSPHRNISSSKL